jgi:kynurenine formamidase
MASKVQMVRRVIDLSLACEPLSTQRLSSSELPAHIEPTGPGHSRHFIQRICHTFPYAFPNGEIAVDVHLGDSLPHTHAESLLVNRVTLLDQIASGQRWAIRDIASVPAAEWVREAAVVDLSQVDPGEQASQTAVREAASRLKPGDFVIWRTGLQQSGAKPAAAPGISVEVARWLVEEMNIVGIMSDAPVDPVRESGRVGSGAGWVHTYFYLNAVLMIDETINFSQLPSSRVFLCGGLALKTHGIGSGPARPVALIGESDSLAEREMVDLFRPMQASSGRPLTAPIERIEPFVMQSDLHKRFEIFGVQIAPDSAESEPVAGGWPARVQRDFGSPLRLFSSHLGTHMRLPHTTTGSAGTADLKLDELREIGSGRLAGPAMLVDLTTVGPQQLITKQMLQKQAEGLLPGDIALLWTAFTDRYYHREDFLSWNPRIELEALRWLLEQGVRMLITDMVRLEPHLWEDHLPSESAPLLAARAVPAVMAATNLWLLRKKRAYVFCSPVPLSGLPTLPARVVAVEEWP